MHPAGEVDLWIVPEEAAVLMDKISRRVLGPRMPSVVRNRRTVPSPAEPLADVIANRSQVSADLRRLHQLRHILLRIAVQLFVRVQNNDPIRLYGFQRGVARLREIVLPRYRNDGGAELPRNVAGIIGAAGVCDHHLLHHAAHTLETRTKRLRAILHDHGEPYAAHSDFP